MAITVLNGHLWSFFMGYSPFSGRPPCWEHQNQLRLRPDPCWDAEASISNHSFPSLLAERPNHGTIVFHGQIDSNHGICICLAVYLTVQTASQPATGPECVCVRLQGQKKNMAATN